MEDGRLHKSSLAINCSWSNIRFQFSKTCKIWLFSTFTLIILLSYWPSNKNFIWGIRRNRTRTTKKMNALVICLVHMCIMLLKTKNKSRSYFHVCSMHSHLFLHPQTLKKQVWIDFDCDFWKSKLRPWFFITFFFFFCKSLNRPLWVWGTDF